MSRAHGKHNHRPAELSPEQKAEYGIDDRDIPGGRTHLVNPQVQHATVPAPEPLAPFRGEMAHGVPPEGNTYHRQPQRKYQPHFEPDRPRVVPVPVYIVEQGGGSRPLRHSPAKHFAAPALGSEPVSICGQDTSRHAVRLLNEGASGAKGVRIGQLNDLAYDAENGVIVGGALLPNAMTSYLEIKTQSPLYCVSLDSNTPVISVIIETETAGAG